MTVPTWRRPSPSAGGRRGARLTALAPVLLAVLSATAMRDARAGGDSVVIEPAAIRDVLINPGKGWFAFGMPQKNAPEVVALSAAGYDRFDWSRLNPSEGTCDWRPVDEAILAWKAAGRSFSFGVMCLNSHTSAPGGYATPKWVFDAGARGTVVDLARKGTYDGTPGPKMVPDFTDPVFLAKLRVFLAAMAARYDGHPDLAYIDIRSYGNWGENHMWPFGLPDISAADFTRHLQMHLDLFRRTVLQLSVGSHTFDATLDWALDRGIGIRRDGICGNSDGSECARALGRQMAVFEFYGGYPWLKEQGWWDGRDRTGRQGHGHRLADCVENGKPSWISMYWPGDAKALVAAERPLVERLANRMGYHFVLARAEHPASLAPGVPSRVTLRWKNEGVAPVYVHCVVALALLDARDEPAEVAWPSGCDPRSWAPGRESHEDAEVTFAKARAGQYRLAVGLVEYVGCTAPIVRLGIAGRTAGGWYPLGRVTVAAAGAPTRRP